MNIKLFYILVFISVLFISCKEQPIGNLVLNEGWKFKTGDQPEWALPSFPDSNWQNISVNQFWEDQGNENYDGYAWYRIHITIPSSIKEASFFNDSLVVFLDKIDDLDQTFINGIPLGENANTVASTTKFNNKIPDNPDAWKTPRKYMLHAEDPRIKWDEENVVAVRVYDTGSGGGLYGKAHIGMRDARHYIDLNLEKYHAVEIKNKTEYSKKVTLINHSDQYDFSGTLYLKVTDPGSNAVLFEEKASLDIGKGKEIIYGIEFTNSEEKYCLLTCTFAPQGSINSFSKEEVIPYILTPPAPSHPRINGARVYGSRPGNPFLYRIPATGERPMVFSAEGLPDGLSLDGQTGIITGILKFKGTHEVMLTAKNNLGQDSQYWTIKGGNTLALTPPMGWNNYNAWGFNIDDDKVSAAADAFDRTGLADYGWNYINIDDAWEAADRMPDGSIAGNENFPDFPRLADYVHNKGLKLGIYSGPGPTTCGGYMASYQHEHQDAATWADWGVDYLKYDWCSYREIVEDEGLPELQKPYRLMRNALDKVNRDIVYSLCQYGMGNVWEWGAEVGGNLWRTSGDITDTWKSMSDIGFNQHVSSPYASPGQWNDPDMLVVGWVGWGSTQHPTKLTPDEQYTHISLWCLLSAPLMIGCDLSRLDDFTLNLLCNDEVLAVDQDQLGKQADKYFDHENIQYWMKPLYDGSYAVGIFNLNEEKQSVHLNFADLKLNGSYAVRDLWRQKDLGEFEDGMDVAIPGHGVVLVKLTQK